VRRKCSVAMAFAAVLSGQSASTTPEFEVASIKATTMTPREPANAGRLIGLRVDGARVDIGLRSLVSLIAMAYSLENARISGPDWMAGQRFDIQAKIPEGTSQEQVPEMLQALLAERFHLKVHHQPRETDVYALLVGKDGLHMKEAGPDAGKSSKPMTAGPGERALLISMQNELGGANTISMLNHRRTVFEGERVTVADLIGLLKRYVDRPVFDRTGLTGAYEIALDVPRVGIVARRIGARGDLPASDDGASEPDISIFSSIQKLGLRLDPQRISLDYIVVDHADKVPTDN
jgi:uncharacterized protein (TIGR03435 family)